MHKEFPSVQRLPVHLPNQQQVTFDETGNIMQVLSTAMHTKLTQWLDFNRRKKELHEQALITDPAAQPHVCLTTLYHNFPKIATWHQPSKKWKERKQRLSVHNTMEYVYNDSSAPVGRVYGVHPREGERYYLRLLLMKIPGATSFDDLKTTFDGSRNPAYVIHDTFQDACRDLGLLQDDQEWISCMRTSATFASAY